MSRVRYILSAVLFLLIFNHCGSDNHPQGNQLGNVPKSWVKYLATGTISATLEVLTENGSQETFQDLVVDLNNGTVSSPVFKLPIGETYRFVVIFYYSLGPNDLIPYAFADFPWLVDEFSESVTFTENEIRYSSDSADPLISADISSGVLPDLDLDTDGWSNWAELRDRVNPRDPNSIPIPPSVEITAQQDGTTTNATITVVAHDNAHVEEIRMIDPICGINEISDTIVETADGSVTRTLRVKIDLLSVSGSFRKLQGFASDGVTPGQNGNGEFDFFVPGESSKPYFVFTNPEEGVEIEGPTVFHGIACSRKSINSENLEFLNFEIGDFNWLPIGTNSDSYLEVVSESIDTALLPNGEVTLNVRVKDEGGKLGQGSRKFKVTNDNSIQVVQPEGRRWIFGNETIVVSISNLPDSNIVLIEGSDYFNLTSSTSGGAIGTLSVSGLDEGTVIPLTLKAIRADGSEVSRVVEFTVLNKPQIQLFEPNGPMVDLGPYTETQLIYRVLNVDPDQIEIGGRILEDPIQTCKDQSGLPGITVCEGTVKVVLYPFSSNIFELSAIRAPTQGEICDEQCENIQELDVGPPN